MPVLGGVRGVALFITLMNRLCSNFTWLHSMLSKDLHLEYAPKTFIKEVHRKNSRYPLRFPCVNAICPKLII